VKSTMRWFPLSILLVLLACTSPHAQDLTWDNDFSRGLRGWDLGRNCTLKREGAMMYLRLQGPMDGGIADCKSPILLLDGAEHEYELTCTYRTDVKDSHLHGGAWLIFYKLGSDEKLVGDWTGLILTQSADWATGKATVRIPEKTQTFQTAIRVQGRKGRILDVRTVTMRRTK